jgi:hypothetical protein
MKLCCFGGMVICMLCVSVSRMCVMSGGFMIAGLMVSGRVAMMLRSARVVLCCLVMVLGCLFRHISSSVPVSVDRSCVMQASSVLLHPYDEDVNAWCHAVENLVFNSGSRRFFEAVRTLINLYTCSL